MDAIITKLNFIHCSDWSNIMTAADLIQDLYGMVREQDDMFEAVLAPDRVAGMEKVRVAIKEMVADFFNQNVITDKVSAMYGLHIGLVLSICGTDYFENDELIYGEVCGYFGIEPHEVGEYDGAMHDNLAASASRMIGMYLANEYINIDNIFPIDDTLWREIGILEAYFVYTQEMLGAVNTQFDRWATVRANKAINIKQQ